MKGIVYNSLTGEVLYKFDTLTLPALGVNEAIKQRPDIDDIEAGAVYVPASDTYTNPAIVPPPDWKALFAAAGSDGGRINVIADYLKLR